MSVSDIRKLLSSTSSPRLKLWLILLSDFNEEAAYPYTWKLVLLEACHTVALSIGGHASRDHRQPVTGFKGEVGLRLDRVAGHQGEVEA